MASQSDWDETVSVGEARSQLSDLLNRAAYGGLRTGISRHGKVVAVLVSPEDAALLRRIKSASSDGEEGESVPPITWADVFEGLGVNLSDEVDLRALGVL